MSKKLKDDEIIVLIGLSDEQINILPKNIIGINKTNSVDELRHYYNIADVFINLSIEETFGLVVGEALACGTPAIVYNSTACAEVIGEKCGIVLNEFRLDNLYNAICVIKENGKDFYSTHAKNHIKNNFSIEKMQKNYFELYQRVMKGE